MITHGGESGQAQQTRLTILQTPDKIRFGIGGKKGESPAPTLFVFTSTMEAALGDRLFQTAGRQLSAEGYLCVSLDLPCHGTDLRPDEPDGLAGWRHRVEQGENFMEDMNLRATKVLDYLIAEGYTDAQKIAACGVSRGGFVAGHFAALDPRIKAAVLYAPVTDLAALHEFHGAEQNLLVRSLSLLEHANQLAGRAIWLVIGDRDSRVDTDRSIDLARRVTAAALAAKKERFVELHVMPEPRGHAIPEHTISWSATWISKTLGTVQTE